MRKALIPLGIAAAIGAVGLSIAAMNGPFVPATIALDGAGGTDATVTSVADFEGVLASPAASRGSAYYSALVGQAKDPEPVAKGNSFGATAVGTMTAEQGNLKQTVDRTLKIAQNEKGAIYHIDSRVTESFFGKYTARTEQNALFAISRFGAFTKFNSYSVSDTRAEGDKTAQYITEAITSNRGKWFTVGISEAHLKEMSSASDPMKAMVIGTCQSLAASYLANYLNSIDQNNQFFQMTGTFLQAHEAELEKRGSTATYYDEAQYTRWTFNWSTQAKPRIVADQQYRSGDAAQIQKQDIELCHLDNIKVDIIENGEGDFYDLFGPAISKVIAASSK